MTTHAPKAGTAADRLILCSCEASFAPDAAVIARGLAAGGASPEIRTCTQMCRSERDDLARHVAGATSVTLACLQEQATLSDALDDADFVGRRSFVDIRDAGGWSDQATSAAPKMAALIAAARMEPPALPFISLKSEGVALVYGRDEQAIAVAKRLADALDVTVMLTRPGEIMPPRQCDFPILTGTIRQVQGHLGSFELTLDGVARALPSSRTALRFEPPRNGAVSRCDLVIDLSGGQPLFAADQLRDGYLRCDPRDAVAVERLIARARDMVGTFDKPKYITFDAKLCAHSRSKITGCTRCLEVCPTGAIAPAGDSVAIDPAICAGCGGCASACPTGAASYALPSAPDLMKRLRVMLRAYRGAGGTEAVLLFHDANHGSELIHALARFGNGLPARVVPVEVNEVTQIGIEQIAAAFAYGATGIAFLTPAKPKHDLLPLTKTIALGQMLLPSLGYDAGILTHIATDDPDALRSALDTLPMGPAGERAVASFQPTGSKRQVMMLALREWHSHAPAQPASIALPAGAPFGSVTVDATGCTLCLSCVSACPADALIANPDRPELSFREDLCVQCGLCQATCPEKVITLEPRLNFAAIAAPPVIKKQEEPYACDNCGTLFGVKSTIERIKAKLDGKHWMFSGPHAGRLSVIGYCEACRIEVAANEAFDPYGASVPQRPRLRTSEDYFRERSEDRDDE